MIGTITRVRTVEKISPKIIASESPRQISSAKTSGKTPAIVVSEVRKIGCIRDIPPSIMLSVNSRPSLIFLFIRSIRTIASFTTIPASATRPIKTGKEKGIRNKLSPIIAPIIASGRVKSIMPNGWGPVIRK